MIIDDVKLMAYADDELPLDERAEIERALGQDAQLRERLAAHQKLRAQLSGAYQSILDEPVSVQLMAAAQGAVRKAEVVDLDARRRAKWSAREWSAMAASLAGGVIIGLGAMNAQAPLIAVTADGMSARGALERALDVQLASDDAGAVRIGLSFRAQDGGYCRTFDLTERGTTGLACRDGEDWDVAITAAQPRQGDVRMAGGSETILAAVDNMIEGEPLDAEAEAQARDAGWR
jgi:hypothetical protein